MWKCETDEETAADCISSTNIKLITCIHIPVRWTQVPTTLFLHVPNVYKVNLYTACKKPTSVLNTKMFQVQSKYFRLHRLQKSWHVLIWENFLSVWFLHYSLLQDAESKSEINQAISAREHFVFTDTDGQVYHITVEGNTVKDGARIPPDVSA